MRFKNFFIKASWGDYIILDGKYQRLQKGQDYASIETFNFMVN